MYGLWGDYFSKNNINHWVQQILPVPIKIENKQADLLMANAGAAVGLLHLNLNENEQKGLEDRAALVWGKEDTTWSYPIGSQCLADVNGDGIIEVVEQGVKGDFKIHVYNPYTHEDIGNTIDNGGIFIAADINNDGKDEIILSSGSILYAYGYNSSNNNFEKLWEISFDAFISRPVYGDIDGDGKGDIVITDRNGFLYLIK
jgi:hypothetical protein